ncbi:MAG: efflux RND transporter periplasmic adaptor subunit [Bacteroidetes bacterium]|nr:efflux RND transporter periplasmic adaptor subunit [Bacteroidota bacterium]MCW5896331.1 efflux RND transporter periplasmic adaptor subunit [Bacteroidota bacterium]
MNTRRILFHGVLIAGMCLFAFGCGDSNADTSNENKVRTTGSDVPVQVQELKPRLFSETLQLSGSIKAYDDIVISPEEGGVVKEWKYAKGQSVPKDAVIVLLTDDVIKPAYDAALAQYKSAELTLQKQQQVYTEQAVSEWQLRTTEYGRDAAKAQAELARGRWERTRIKTPVGGILDERYADVGEMAPPGVPIARVVNINRVKIAVNIPERYAGSIKLGTQISLSVLAFPGKLFTGTISFVGAAISPDNRTFPVEAVIANPNLMLKPEMIAKTQLSLSAQKEALLIEESIVQQLDRNKMVVFIEQNGKAKERIVQLGGRHESYVEILSGLEAGDRVITAGFTDVIDGQSVVATETHTK